MFSFSRILRNLLLLFLCLSSVEGQGYDYGDYEEPPRDNIYHDYAAKHG